MPISKIKMVLLTSIFDLPLIKKFPDLEFPIRNFPENMKVIRAKLRPVECELTNKQTYTHE